jgi:hypothetical protein
MRFSLPLSPKIFAFGRQEHQKEQQAITAAAERGSADS